MCVKDLFPKKFKIRHHKREINPKKIGNLKQKKLGR